MIGSAIVVPLAWIAPGEPIVKQLAPDPPWLIWSATLGGLLVMAIALVFFRSYRRVARDWADRQQQHVDRRHPEVPASMARELGPPRPWQLGSAYRPAATSVMFFAGLGMVVGIWIDPRFQPRLFLSVWLVTLGLVSLLMILAGLDLLGIRRRALTERRALMAENRRLLTTDLRRLVRQHEAESATRHPSEPWAGEDGSTSSQSMTEEGR